jgi:excisionase family DNA binding protein
MRSVFLEITNVSVRANHLRIEQVLEFVDRERHEALAVRDPLAIAFAAERYNTIAAVLAEFPRSETLDLYKPLLSVSQAAKLLGYNAKEVRRLLGQGKLSGKKINNQWRIPLKAVL